MVECSMVESDIDIQILFFTTRSIAKEYGYDLVFISGH